MNSNSKNLVQFWINTEIHTQTQHSQYVERQRERENFEREENDSLYIIKGTINNRTADFLSETMVAKGSGKTYVRS